MDDLGLDTGAARLGRNALKSLAGSGRFSYRRDGDCNEVTLGYSWVSNR